MNHKAATDLGNRLRTARAKLEKRDGKVSDERVARELYARHGVEISRERVRQYHAGEVDPTTADPTHLLGFSSYYDLRTSQLGGTAERRIEALRHLLASQRRCTVSYAASAA